MKTQSELFCDIDRHLMEDVKPSEYLSTLLNNSVFNEYPFEMLVRMKRTKQSPKHHPEGDVWVHTLLVVDEAAKRKNESQNPRAFMWAALLHDIGKPPTTRHKNGKLVSYGHDKVGTKLTREFLGVFEQCEGFIDEVAALVRWHMQILFIVNDRKFAEMDAMRDSVDADEVALLGLCDRLGRKGANKKEEEDNIREFLRKCKN